jgi:hypothetical protein
MIYRFSGNSPDGKFEIQLHAPSGLQIDSAKRKLKGIFAEKGFNTGPLEFDGSMDFACDGLVLPEDADTDTIYIVKAREIQTSEDVLCAILGWYSPGGNEIGRNRCIVKGCGREAVFQLCQEHAAPGMVVEVESGSGAKCVISSWLVETERRVEHFTIYDCSLGRDFGGRQGLENRLVAQGYRVLKVISSQTELAEAKARYPWLHPVQSAEWLPRLLGREADSRVAS